MSEGGGSDSRTEPGPLIEQFVFPMSFAQQRLWFLDEIAPGNPFYNIPLRLPLRGRVDAPAIEHALNGVIQRHETLRTTFEVIDGEPSQVVWSARPIELARQRVDHLAGDRRAEAVDALAVAEARAPFDLRTGPLVRATLVTCGAVDSVLLLTLHHIVADGWSVAILSRELSALYAAEAMGRTVELRPLPVQYADFTLWQRDHLQGDRLDGLLEYWRRQLENLPVLAMPTDRPRPRVLDYTGAYVPVEIPAELAAQVRTVARREQATPFMVLMAAFASLLGRYSAQEDVVVGTPIANRNNTDTEQLIGFFVNSLIVRCDLSGDPTFREVLRRVRDTCLDAYAHQDLPFEQLVEDLKPDRDLGRNPLFQVTFQLVNTPDLDADVTDSGASPAVQRGSAIFDLAFTLVDSPSSLRGMIEYSTQLFDAATVIRFAAHFRLLLRAAVADPGRCVADISFLTGPERDLLVAHHHPRPEVAPAPGVVADSVRVVPHAVAIVAGDGELTFGELDQRADVVAARLSRIGVGRGDLVAVLCDGSTWLPAIMLGVVRLGAAYLPLDPLQPRGRLVTILDDSTPAAIVADAGSIIGLPLSDVPVVRVDELERAAAVIAGGGTDVDQFDRPDGRHLDPAYVLYTSGSSGVPKGVVIPRSALDNHMAWLLSEFSFGPEDRVLQRTTTVFDASVWEFWAPMMCGGRLVLLDAEAKRDPSRIAAAVRRHRITVLQVVPGLLRALLDEPDFLASDSLRVVFCGGEALTVELCDRFSRTFEVPLVNLYGPTEATIDATFHRCTTAPGDIVPIGRPIRGTGALVLDRGGRPTPIGVPGRLYLSGAGLALGYLRRPRLTAERFIPDEFGPVPGARLYDTGDLARFRTDGQLEYLGRLDRQVKLRGFRIELDEVERALQACSGVQRAAATVHRDQIIAHLAPERAAGSSPHGVDEVEQEVLDRWEDVYEQVYGDLGDAGSPDLATTGWISSFTGRPIDDRAMAEWRDQTIERILALAPRRVLEIGCGTGMVLSGVAPATERYVGLDLSAPALRYLAGRVAGRSLAPVELLHRPAHHLDDLEGDEFDVVVLNSVVQYFPSARYLHEVLDSAARCLRPGGSIFVGDVRSLPLLGAFHTAVELSRCDGSEPAASLRRRIDDAVSREEELVVAPELFFDASARHPGSTCEVRLKRTRQVTEMSTYRYDVILRIGGGTVSPGEVTHLDWRRHQLETAGLAARLGQDDGVVAVSGIPDGLVREPLAVLAAARHCSPGATVADLRELAARDGIGVDTEVLQEMARRAGRVLTLRISIGDEPGRVDAVFCPAGTEPPPHRLGSLDPAVPRSNEPERGALAGRLIPSVRAALEQRLPEYMWPARFMVLHELPTLPNGKIDRGRLQPPDDGRPTRITPFVEPVDRLEEVLVEVWREVIGVGTIGTHDDLFADLGGHSLLAARLAARLRAVLELDVPLRLVFDAPTIVELAAVLRAVWPLDTAVTAAAGGNGASAGGASGSVEAGREVEHVGG